jgi:hypothetical protein
MSQEHVPSDPELSPIESALGSLVPARSRIDRDRVMFLAGQAAARPSTSGRRAWLSIAASLLLIALGEAALLARRPPPRVVERVVVVHEPATAPVDPGAERAVAQAPASRPTESPRSLGHTPYERLAGQVLRYGLDGLPASPSAARTDSRPGPASSGQLLQEEIRRILDPGDPS